MYRIYFSLKKNKKEAFTKPERKVRTWGGGGGLTGVGVMSLEEGVTRTHTCVIHCCSAEGS